MTNDEYLSTQNALVLIRSMLTTLDLGAFIQTGERAETVGPLLNPTLYLEGGAELKKVIALAKAAKAMQACEMPAYMEGT